uniref:Putative secreted protein n=1 Tax=Ixodes ricinus TaxID=34613 RepID=A0A6B0U1Q6_IXORI
MFLETFFFVFLYKVSATCQRKNKSKSCYARKPKGTNLSQTEACHQNVNKLYICKQLQSICLQMPRKCNIE